MKEKIFRANQKYQVQVESLLLELSKFSTENLNQTPENGGWSAIQTAWHLLLVEENTMKYIQKKLGYGAVFQKAGLGARWRTFCLSVAIYLPLKFKAPVASSGENLPLYSTFEEIKERWEASRASWNTFFSTLPAALEDKAVFKHPRIGKIGWMQMLSFFQSHFDRHLRQIRKALA